ncbi:MAG: hypothetical protein HY518_03025 [Candidatus Aenigmarchaeota archaeon]|nr:hypothetical protein [Candidatus Aenigmarchaeota archaeon]
MNTYPAARIRLEGDTPAVREDIKKSMLRRAEQSFEEGRTGLEEGRQRDIYRSIRHFIDFRYRVVPHIGKNL